MPVSQITLRMENRKERICYWNIIKMEGVNSLSEISYEKKEIEK